MRNLNEDNITQAVLARHAAMPDVRLREIMTSLVQHLHSFAREVKLLEAGTAPDGSRLDVPFFTLDFDFVLNPVP